MDIHVCAKHPNIGFQEKRNINKKNVGGIRMKILRNMLLIALSTAVILTIASGCKSQNNSSNASGKPITIEYASTNVVGSTDPSAQAREARRNFTQLLAALSLVSVSVLIIYSLFSNKIMEGMTAGAVKG